MFEVLAELQAHVSKLLPAFHWLCRQFVNCTYLCLNISVQGKENNVKVLNLKCQLMVLGPLLL